MKFDHVALEDVFCSKVVQVFLLCGQEPAGYSAWQDRLSSE